MTVKREHLVIAALLVLLAVVGLSGMIARSQPSPAPALAPALPLACNDCLSGCQCGDCVKCLPARPVTPVVDPCKCGPLKGCACPSPATYPKTVSVSCYYCRREFNVREGQSAATCPYCSRTLSIGVVGAGQVGKAFRAEDAAAKK
jgi:hypothetical protein